MPASAHDVYLESTILSADPVELVRILYRTALDAVREARMHLGCGDVSARGKSVSRALDVINELNGSLDHQSGGALSRRLSELYDYMQRRLIEGNYRQEAESLDEVSALLATLLEAWQAVGIAARPHESERFAADLRQLASLPEFQAEMEYAPQAWSA
jgi:flagellar secretion chaperone FliS